MTAYLVEKLSTDLTPARTPNAGAILVLLTLGFGLVGLDRFMILPMFPVLAQSLHLGYQDIGLITGALSITWGCASIFVGNLSDRFGLRRVAVLAIFGFSLIVGVSGFATGLLSLVLLRGLVGLLDGAFTPAAMVANFESSPPRHIGRNVGIMQAAMPFFGLAVAPIVVTHLLIVIDWRYVFVLLSAPGLIVAWLLWRALGKPVVVNQDLISYDRRDSWQRWREAFANSNVKVNSVCICCWMACLVVVSALLPSFMMDYLHLSLVQMGGVLSALGFGATAGGLVMPMLSDRFGRKPVALTDAVGTVIFLALIGPCGNNTGLLFAALFGTAFFLYNLLGMTVSTMTAESVPANVRTTAAGLVVGAGELFGSGIVPIIAGRIVRDFGISYVPVIAIAAMLVGCVALLFFRETYEVTR
jgi:MFS family permease